MEKIPNHHTVCLVATGHSKNRAPRPLLTRSGEVFLCVSEGCVIFCRIIKASSSSVGRSFVFWQHRKLNRRVDKLMDFDLCSCSLISSDEQLDRQDRITQHYEPLSSSSSSYFSSARYPSTPLSFIDRRGIGPPEWTEQLLLHLVSPTSNSIAPSFFSLSRSAISRLSERQQSWQSFVPLNPISA